MRCMEITYLGHSAFKLRGKQATVVTDPYGKSVGFLMPKVSADLVTVSHGHEDHNAYDRVGGTTRREKPYVITAPGEYEVSSVGVFGWGSYHDRVLGKERGANTVYTIHMDNLTLAHMGDIGELPSDELYERLGLVDILFVPVGGVYTIGPEEAAKVVARLKPALVIPMHYRTADHNQETFGKMETVEAFLKAMDMEVTEMPTELKITELDLPEETEVVVLKRA